MATSGVQSTLARAAAALERGHGGEAVQIVTPLLRSGLLSRDNEFALRAAVAEGWLQQDELAQAASAIGRTPDTHREPLPDALVSTLWRLHGRITFQRGEQSRAIALHTRALKHAELSHESRAIGLAHYELATCYKQVGDSGTVRDHLTEAASALHAAGDRRHLALVHSLSAVLLAQSGRYEEAHTALRQGEALAHAIQAGDVLAGIVHNQANVALMRHRHGDALALAERSVELHEALGSGHGLAVALATLGQICVQLGELGRAEETLTRSLAVRSAVQFGETTGAVFDTLAQIHLMRGEYDKAEDAIGQAGEAYGTYGSQTMRWYEWSLRLLRVKVAIRRGLVDEALALADEIAATPGVPPADAAQAELSACEALIAAGRTEQAEVRLTALAGRLDRRTAPATWGEYLRVRGTVGERLDRLAAARHDFAQSATVFDLLGERYQAAVSRLAQGRVAARAGFLTQATAQIEAAAGMFTTLGALHDLGEADRARQLVAASAPLDRIEPDDADDAVVRRLVDASIFDYLLARETVTVFVEVARADAAVVFEQERGGGIRIMATAGRDEAAAEDLARAALAQRRHTLDRLLFWESLGRTHQGQRYCAALAPQPAADTALRRLRMFAAVARQGFELCAAREPSPLPDAVGERSLEPLLPGFVCASPAMLRVSEQIQRLQGHDLTVLITGESGTGKDLVARAIHAGSRRSARHLVPYNCTTTTRELADSQLFGHRRGAFTGAVTDQPGLIRSATGSTLLLDEVGDLPIDVQPKLLRFLEQGEVMPIGDTRPLAVDVRVLAATNADLEQRVAEGRFREDLYYRLSVIRIHVPPLRERREDIPHLTTFFLRDARERMGNPDVHFSRSTLDLFVRYWWPGNVRQLRNEIQRAVAMSAPGATIEPEHLSAELAAPAAGVSATTSPGQLAPSPGSTEILARLVEQVERQAISAAMERSHGNVTHAARALGLTRRGLYLKMQRLGIRDMAGA
ncbi:MAG: sigma 54-interacting transcriptional regulator [Vicinamibacterales bacterium]